MPGGDAVSLPSVAEVEHADWPTLKGMCESLGLNGKGRSDVVRSRVLEFVHRHSRPQAWKPSTRTQAALLNSLGFTDPAIRLWESAIELDAPAPWIGLGRAQLHAGELEEAVKSFDRAVQMDDAVAFLHRAEALAAGGDFDGAIRACDAFLVARPGNFRGLLLKAGFLARGGWTDEAASVLRNAFEAHPQLGELWRGLGILLLKGGRAEAAAKAFHEAVRSSPRDVDAWVNRGVALLLHGERREAIGAFREALEADPAQATALADLGVAYLRGGQVKSAVVNLERAARRAETPQILLNLAGAQEAAQEHAAALETYHRVLRLRPRDPEALAGRKRLEPRKSRKQRARAIVRRKPKRTSAKGGRGTKRKGRRGSRRGPPKRSRKAATPRPAKARNRRARKG
jgi:tetratricopeptide (TPR) repeat protein